MKSLPNPIKPSALIRIAIRDEEKAHASSDHTVDMEDWHEPLGSTCAVCFAGAVMAFTLDVDARTYIQPKKFDRHTSNCLLALNSFRRGKVCRGLHKMGLSYRRKTRKLERYVMPYRGDRLAFRCAMKKIANDLEAIDL